MAKAKTTDETAQDQTMAIVPLHASGWTAISSLAEAMQVAEVVAKSAALPDVRNAGQALLKILAGAEMGFGPFASLVDVHIIEGKPAVGAHLKAAAIKRSDRYDYEIVESTDQACELVFYERAMLQGGEVRKRTPGWIKKSQPVRLTVQEAEARGLTRGKEGTKKNWRSHAKAMLFARCISEGYKQHAPDLTGGVLTYDPDELDSAPLDAARAEVVQSALPATRPAIASAIAPAAEIQDAEVVAGEGKPQTTSPVMCCEEQVVRFDELTRGLALSQPQIANALKARGVTSYRQLTAAQAIEVNTKLEQMLAAKAETALPPQAG